MLFVHKNNEKSEKGGEFNLTRRRTILIKLYLMKLVVSKFKEFPVNGPVQTKVVIGL